MRCGRNGGRSPSGIKSTSSSVPISYLSMTTTAKLQGATSIFSKTELLRIEPTLLAPLYKDELYIILSTSSSLDPKMLSAILSNLKHLERLQGRSNYQVWRSSMEGIFELGGLWDIVSGLRPRPTSAATSASASASSSTKRVAPYPAHPPAIQTTRIEKSTNG